MAKAPAKKRPASAIEAEPTVLNAQGVAAVVAPEPSLGEAVAPKELEEEEKEPMQVDHRSPGILLQGV